MCLQQSSQHHQQFIHVHVILVKNVFGFYDLSQAIEQFVHQWGLELPAYSDRQQRNQRYCISFDSLFVIL